MFFDKIILRNFREEVINLAKYEVELPKVLYLVFKISKFAKDNVYYNTTDLCELANSFKPE